MVTNVKKILFATDLTNNSKYAFSYAALEAMTHGANMVLIHVMEDMPESVESYIEGFLGKSNWDKFQKENFSSARQKIIGKKSDYDIIKDALHAYPSIADFEKPFEAQEVLVVSGEPAEQILKYAEERECDLIVLGAHKGIFGKRSLGSVAKEVLHGAKIPVLIIPPAP
ncbi:MAG: hypothetical protein C0608_07625 [Deltaproteobacteria bacterium]|nr:MAG: hypothetical protein C0608_07625 [Deltaproteobacteria bacterium]